MSNKIRKEQIDNGENLLFGGADLSLGSSNIETSGTVIVADEAYSSDWNGSTEVPTKNAVYDKLETILVSGDVASVNGATGIVVLDTDDISEGATNQYHTDERAQDAVGAMVNSTLVYTDATPALGRAAITGDVTISAGSNTAAIGTGVIVNADINASAAIAATKIADGTISNTEFQYLNGVTSAIQTQLDAKVADTGDETIAGVKTFSSIPVLPGTDPTTANQATRKGYVDVIAASVDPSLYKNSCEVATTANISLSGEQTIDTFATSATRVLVWKQTAPAENGIYISNSGAWTRASDYNTSGEVLQGTSTFVVDGSANKNRLFVMNAASITTIGTDAITFTPLSGAAEYIAGDGIDITANTISVVGGADLVTHTGTLVDNAIPMFNGTSGVIEDSGFYKSTSANTIGIPHADGVLFGQNFSISDGGGNYSRSSTLSTRNLDDISWAREQYLSAKSGATYSSSAESKAVANTREVKFSSEISYTDDNNNTVSSRIRTGSVAFGNTERYSLTTLTAGVDSSSTIENVSKGYFSIEAHPTANINANRRIMISTENLTANRIVKFPDAAGTVSLNPEVDIQVFTSDGTWTKPAGAKSVHVQLIGGGGGGGSGRKGAVSTIRCGGGGGGNGGTAFMTFNASVLGSTETVTVGTGGAGGASRTTNDTNGLAGTAGETTFFGGWLRAGRGSGGSGGTNASGTGGTSGQTFPYGTAGTSGASASTSGGPGSGGGGASALAPGGGASGAGLTTGNIASGGGNGQGIGVGGEAANSGYATSVAGGSGGGTNTNGGNGNASPTNTIIGGTGGGGGGSSTTTNAGNGGNAGLYGAGGGGGGAAVNSVGNSGAGGSGANGIAIITTYF